MNKEIPEWILENLCYYDERNPNTIVNLENLSQEELSYNQVEGEDFASKDCSCDNCFYNRTRLANELVKMYEKKLE